MEKNREHTVCLELAYDGAPFSGFARQPAQLTVQGSLEDALSLLYKRQVETTCAGRTDAGVHARGQVTSFDLNEDEFGARSLSTLIRSLNALIDERAAVKRAWEAPRGFSARFDAVSREYRYFIYEGKERPVLIADRVWHLKKTLDIEAMAEGARFLVGEHDFKSFCLAASAEGKPTCRNVSEITIGREELLGERVVAVRIVGNAFLHSMVRTIVGTLASVGIGQRDPLWVKRVLDACDRRAAGENAPACGLVFWHVDYGCAEQSFRKEGNRV
ncbi:tRNA pseudouridine(38-40) synthase TruA [Raoultibacter phocaeensis]|uniref:tRNA pseudouridine(38-40) synthase TruA n=1 Tax=Raoultibacter phocaeensis TaxID=2479841 RepID=UPI0011184EB6|nr:tRNA pseudouridine(38-40) synthase TruA [Raoultibacter phocaeensis]